MLAIPNSLAAMLQDVHKDVSALTGIVEKFVLYNINKDKSIVSLFFIHWLDHLSLQILSFVL